MHSRDRNYVELMKLRCRRMLSAMRRFNDEQEILEEENQRLWDEVTVLHEQLKAKEEEIEELKDDLLGTAEGAFLNERDKGD